MTTPEVPTTGVDAPPIPTQTPATPTEIDVRELATQITASQLSFDPSTIRKAVVTGIDLGGASTPPTVTVNISGDTSVPIVGVRLSDDYSPQIGDTVLILKQGSEVFCLTHIADQGSKVASSDTGGWTLASLSGGLSHNGNSNGNLMYRRTLEDGCWKMQWKGGIAGTAITGTILSAGLSTDFRPATKQSLITAREIQSGSNVIGLDFRTDGQVEVVGSTTAPFTQTPNDSTHGHSSDYGGNHYHQYEDTGHNPTTRNSYGESNDHNHGIFSSTHNHGGHHHDVNGPNWISFGNVEYFL